FRAAARTSGYAVAKLSPQPHCCRAFGLSKRRRRVRPSWASRTVVPWTYGRLAGSTATRTPPHSNSTSSARTASSGAMRWRRPEQPAGSTARRTPALPDCFASCTARNCAASAVSVTGSIVACAGASVRASVRAMPITTSPDPVAWQASRALSCATPARSSMSSSSSVGSLSNCPPSRTSTQHVEQASFPPQSCASETPALSAPSSRVSPWPSVTVKWSMKVGPCDRRNVLFFAESLPHPLREAVAVEFLRHVVPVPELARAHALLLPFAVARVLPVGDVPQRHIVREVVLGERQVPGLEQP